MFIATPSAAVLALSVALTTLTCVAANFGFVYFSGEQTCDILRFSKGKKNRIGPHESIWMR